MRLELPRQTLSIVHGRNSKKASVGAGWGSLGVREFQVPEPGGLGEYVFAPVRKKEERQRGALPASITVPRISGNWNDALSLAGTLEAAPGAYFRGRAYCSGNLAGYIGSANALRARSPRGDATWGPAGWEIRGGRRYEEEFKQVDQLLQRVGSIDGALEAIRRLQHEDQTRLFLAVQAALGKGDLKAWRESLVPRELEWEAIQGLALPLRLVTEEQVAMAAPWIALDDVRSSLAGWKREGLLAVHGEVGGAPIMRVTEAAVQRGLDEGLLDEFEAHGRLVVRRGQELHDLAVGDAMILNALQAAEGGGRVLEVRTEQALKLEHVRGVFPDYVMVVEPAPGAEIRVMSVEVVGTGGMYRSKGKRSAVAAAGIQMLHTGLDGKGVRYA